MTSATEKEAQEWVEICRIDDLPPDAGVCALVEGDQVAIFYLPKEGALYAIHNYDPLGKANVLSRGVIGDLKGELVVASPLYKHHYSLTSGRCLEDAAVRVKTYPVRQENGCVFVGQSREHRLVS